MVQTMLAVFRPDDVMTRGHLGDATLEAKTRVGGKNAKQCE